MCCMDIERVKEISSQSFPRIRKYKSAHSNGAGDRRMYALIVQVTTACSCPGGKVKSNTLICWALIQIEVYFFLWGLNCSQHFFLTLHSQNYSAKSLICNCIITSQLLSIFSLFLRNFTVFRIKSTFFDFCFSGSGYEVYCGQMLAFTR